MFLWVKLLVTMFCFPCIVEPDEWQEDQEYAQEYDEGQEGERDAWFEFRSVMDATHLSPVSACAFDPIEELLWTGSAAVCVPHFSSVISFPLLVNC